MRVSLACLVLIGCAGAATPPAAVDRSLPPLPAPSTSVVDRPAPVFPDDADPALTTIDQATHARARAAARAGQLHEAKRLLGFLAFAYPDHATLIAQYNAVGARIEQAQAAAKAGLESAPLRTPPSPPVAYSLVRPAPVTDAHTPRLMKKSQVKNKITDEEAWFQKNDLRTSEYIVERPGEMLRAPGILSTQIAIDLRSSFVYIERVPSHRYREEPLPLAIPLDYGTFPLMHAFDSAPYVVGIYGERVVVVFDTSFHVAGVFDLDNFSHPPANKVGKAVVGSATLSTSDGTVVRRADLTVDTNTISLQLGYAAAADGVLYVQHAVNGYTKEAKGQTGYVTALDIATGELLWRSAPQVANGTNFLVVGGALVTGFGFTAEPRFVYVLDRATGVKRQTVSTSTTPEIFVLKNGVLHVRGYDSDYVFTP